MQLNFRNLIMLSISGGVVDLNFEPRAWIVKDQGTKLSTPLYPRS